jgi:hypothetical protein
MVKMIEEVEDRTVGGVYIFESHSERWVFTFGVHL